MGENAGLGTKILWVRLAACVLVSGIVGWRDDPNMLLIIINVIFVELISKISKNESVFLSLV